jgi:hypothetical protein
LEADAAGLSVHDCRRRHQRHQQQGSGVGAHAGTFPQDASWASVSCGAT